MNRLSFSMGIKGKSMARVRAFAALPDAVGAGVAMDEQSHAQPLSVRISQRTHGPFSSLGSSSSGASLSCWRVCRACAVAATTMCGARSKSFASHFLQSNTSFASHRAHGTSLWTIPLMSRRQLGRKGLLSQGACASM